MRDAMWMVYCLWLFYGVALVGRPETFSPLLWVIGIATIFLTLLGMFVETAHSAQAKIMAELQGRLKIEAAASEYKLKREYEEWKAAQQPGPNKELRWNEQGSYYADKPGYHQ